MLDHFTHMCTRTHTLTTTVITALKCISFPKRSEGSSLGKEYLLKSREEQELARQETRGHISGSGSVHHPRVRRVGSVNYVSW